MNALLLRNLGGLRRSSSLVSFAEYKQSEASNPQMSSVTSEGTLLEYETLELRIHPPNVVIDNETYDDVTVITIDSANRPGTLIEVVQCLTELGLSIRCARISSDGGWFVDEFFVTETPKGKIVDQRKINIIRKVLSIETDAERTARDKELCTVFELAGRDRHGLLAAVLQLLVVNGCEVLSAAVWTFHDRVALVISATERGAPVVDPPKLDRLEQILYDMLGGGDAVVNSEMVRGDVHHERRLHHLLLLEELKAWEQQYVAQAVTPTHGTSTHGSTAPTSNGHSALPPASTASTGSAATDAYAAQAAAVAAAAAAVAADSSASAPAFSRTSLNAGMPGAAAAGPVGLPPRAPSPAPATVFAGSGGATAAAGASMLQAEGSGNLANSGISTHGYTSAGFPQADEGGAACPQAAAGPGTGSGGAGGGLGPEASGGFAAAPAGPFDEGPHLGRCGSSEGPLGALGGHHGLGVSEPLIDVGLDLPAAVQLQEQGALCMDRRRSTAGPGGLPVVVGPDGIPVSPQATADSTVFGRAPVGGAGASGEIPRATSTNALTGMGSGGGGAVQGSAVVGVPPGLPPLVPARQTSTRTMTVTGEEGETGQAAPPPAPTAVPPSLGGAAVAAADGGPAAALTGSAGGAAQDQLAPLRRSEVRIQHSTLLNYWLVTIRCRDRNKLFFDTVCTLADMNYDIYHATIDSEGDAASQLFYVRPRYGECVWDERRAAKLRYMLESAVQRRFPRGTKVCVQSGDRSSLVALFSALSSGGFWITRADVRAHGHDNAVFEFTITDTRGQLPEQTHVQRICEAVGGVLTPDVYAPVGGMQNGNSSSRMAAAGRASGAPGAGGVLQGTFRFSILERRWKQGWNGAQGGAGGGAGGNSYESAVSSGSM
ncbi:hypothetical protein HYH02_002244 [Chlamydomonas schloesseri]|uniref:ACT domain-containing protein n=1 Tax=Chlamydomonas schloesseri TaxID=2026947 RepID=A0A836BAR0_9CHLO|nr:hypothetical protein HYH02_002244 [Chlamydomonas schloesseri]|eukprot:KAG2452901.1 hypothetical protein HYH02_002244 [Chlamydomonas schloesseri]